MLRHYVTVIPVHARLTLPSQRFMPVPHGFALNIESSYRTPVKPMRFDFQWLRVLRNLLDVYIVCRRINRRS